MAKLGAGLFYTRYVDSPSKTSMGVSVSGVDRYGGTRPASGGFGCMFYGTLAWRRARRSMGYYEAVHAVIGRCYY